MIRLIVSQPKTFFIKFLIFFTIAVQATAEANCVSSVIQVFFRKYFLAKPWDASSLDKPAFDLSAPNPGELARMDVLKKLTEANNVRPRIFEVGEFDAYVRIVNTTTTALFDPATREVTYGKSNVSIGDIINKVFALRELEVGTSFMAPGQFVMPPIRRYIQNGYARSKTAIISALVFVVVVNLSELGLGSVRQGLFGILSGIRAGNHRPTSDLTAITLGYNSAFTYNEQYGLARLNNAELRLELINNSIKPDDPKSVQKTRRKLKSFAFEFKDLLDPDGPPVTENIRDGYHELLKEVNPPPPHP